MKDIRLQEEPCRLILQPLLGRESEPVQLDAALGGLPRAAGLVVIQAAQAARLLASR